MGLRHNDAYFVLCCLNQFGDLPLLPRLEELTPAINAPGSQESGLELADLEATAAQAAQAAQASQAAGGTQSTVMPAPMLETLIYGLFRPMSGDRAPDVELTRQLLTMLAFQLRMYRRRGVIPTLANLGVFLVAYIFSVVLAFAQLGDENTPFSLAFGLLVTWLPLLVIFSIVDRNPVSSKRTS